jgi:hypothetical protein
MSAPDQIRITHGGEVFVLDVIRGAGGRTTGILAVKTWTGETDRMEEARARAQAGMQVLRVLPVLSHKLKARTAAQLAQEARPSGVARRIARAIADADPKEFREAGGASHNQRAAS